MRLSSKNVEENEGIDLLKSQLRNSQNDLRRSQTQILRLQRELEKEKKKNLSKGNDEEEYYNLENDSNLLQESAQKSIEYHETLEKYVHKIIVQIQENCYTCLHCNPHGNEQQEENTDIQKLKQMKKFISSQKDLICSLRNENSKLLYVLNSRPSTQQYKRELLEIDCLNKKIQVLRKENRRLTKQLQFFTKSSFSPVNAQEKETEQVKRIYDASATNLIERINADKLLNALEVESKKRIIPKRLSLGDDDHKDVQSFTFEEYEHYIVINESIFPTQPEQRVDIVRRVGVICSEIVAKCCVAFDLKKIADIPTHIETTKRSITMVPILNDFVESIEKIVYGDELKKSRSLDKLLSRIEEIVYELQALREQLEPTGLRAHRFILECMGLFQVSHMENVVPMIRKLLFAVQSEQDFLVKLRKAVGIQGNTTKEEILEVVSEFFDVIGLQTIAKASKKEQKSSGQELPPIIKNAEDREDSDLDDKLLVDML